MTENKMSWSEFGRALINTRDLDPLYVALQQLPPAKRARFMITYWLFYHTGVASLVTDTCNIVTFWSRLLELFDTGVPRGTERRHFRGEKARNAILYLQQRFPSYLSLLGWLEEGARAGGFKELSNRVQELPQFGPWMAFKVADMLERCSGFPVAFDGAELMMYREPVRGAALIIHGDKDAKLSPDEMRTMVYNMDRAFAHFRAPGGEPRRLNVQEFETVLCKYKSYVGGHYHVGKDIQDHYDALQHPDWAGPTAILLSAAYRKMGAK